MAKDRATEWVDVGRLVWQPELGLALERMQEEGSVRVEDGHLHLRVGHAPSQSVRGDMSSLLQNVLIDRRHISHGGIPEPQVNGVRCWPLIQDHMVRFRHHLCLPRTSSLNAHLHHLRPGGL